MSAIAGEHTPTAPTGVLTRVRLKWLAYATLGGIIAFVGARYGYEYWSVERSSKAPTTPMPGAMSRRYRPTWRGSSLKSSLATTNMCAQDSR
jgi:hypothetical protein